MIDAKITGTDEVIKLIGNISKEVRENILRSALSDAARQIKDQMVAEAPISPKGMKGTYAHKKGNLKRSIGIRWSKTGGDYPTFYVGPDKNRGVDAYYAGMVERGHLVRTADSMNSRGRIKKGHGTTFIPANPFIRRTYDKMDSKMRAFIEMRIKQGINGMVQ